MNNEFMVIPEFPRYEINRKGEIRNIRTQKIKKPQINNGGYHSISLFDGIDSHTKTIHRLVAKIFLSNLNNLPCVNHIDGNKLNNNIENLEWCTSSENNAHAYRIGLKPLVHGENNQQAKLTELQVIEIKKLANSGLTQKEIGKLFNISRPNVNGIIMGHRWKHVSI